MNLKNVFGVMGALALLVSVSSCGGPKKVESNQGDVEIVIPFSSPADRSDATYFRATGQSSSPDMPTAKKIATLNARTELASGISAVLKAVSEQYINQVSIADKQEYSSKFEEMTRAVVNQELKSSIIRGEKVFKSKEGKYTYYVNMEMSKATLQEAIEESISKDEKTALEFDKYMFKKVFDEEMNKFENK